MTRVSLVMPVTVGLYAVPGAAHAHLVTSGLGPFYDGALHLLLSPGDLLGLIALALLAGLRGSVAARPTLIALTLCWLLAGLVGRELSPTTELAWLNFAVTVALGLLIAADIRLPSGLVAALGGLFGVFHGLLNGSTLTAQGDGATSLLGIVTTALVVVLLVSATVVSLRQFWARVAVRVAGSWIVAVGVMMLGWMLQGAA